MAAPTRIPTILATLLIASTALLGLPVQGTTVTHHYDAPSSFVIRGIFGFGYLTCAEPLLEPVDAVANNGACIDYTGFEEEPYVLNAQDETWDAVSITLAVDVDGDGCVSSGCGDRDYRANACGPISGVLPEVDAGVDPVIRTFIRVIDVDPDSLELCGGTSGDIVVVYG